jgi:hypothetical protein
MPHVTGILNFPQYNKDNSEDKIIALLHTETIKSSLFLIHPKRGT